MSQQKRLVGSLFLTLSGSFGKMGTDDGGSRIFAGYRPLGYVSNDVPCITRWVRTTVVFSLIGVDLLNINLKMKFGFSFVG
jgi:hypothetical protein